MQPQDKYCEKCGTQLANQVTAVVHSHGETRQGTEISQDDLIVFVGNNQAYYLQKWMTSLQPEKRSGWNWVAFFFAPMWFAYRKMYLQAFIFFIVQSIVSSITFGITGLAGAIIGGLFGNAYYYKHAKQKIQQTMLSTDNPDMRKMKLMQAGGTSKGALILVIVLWLLWSTLTTLAGMPA
ncbi:DUF2628 domain-containing protein [Brevibacillus fluminis]|uniref:DUF2628 domain-containing protein n=1 Tax=Brevibacillus fluminis TaxID=511487 RepID=UPI003F8BBE68